MTRLVVAPWLSWKLRWLVAGLGVTLAVGSGTVLRAQDAGLSPGAQRDKRESSLGGLSSEQIRQAIRLGIPQLQQCYAALAVTRPLQGLVAVSFVIDAAGRVGQAQIESNHSGSRELGDCVLRSARFWRFPEPPQGGQARVSAYPFVFSLYPSEKKEVWLDDVSWPVSIPLPTPIPPNVPDATRPGSVQAFVERFGACSALWREGYVPSAPERKSFEAQAEARPRAARPSKAVQDPAGPKEYLYQVETCYVRALEVPAWATIKGRLSLRLAIGADGKVVAARASARELVPELGCCVQNAALEWRFPAGGAFRVVDYAFALKQPTGRGVDVQWID